MIFNNALELIGNTPIVRVNKLTGDNSSDVYLKLEKFNPGGSVKDRAALGMIEKAEERGILKPGGTIIEPTSGNTGIAIAMIGRLKGYKVIIVMPENMSKERRAAIKAYGAELILTNGIKGMKGAIEKADELAKNKGYFLPQQFNNKDNLEKHYNTTANEVLKDIPDLDVLVAGVGTSGTIMGIAKKIKELKKEVKIIAVEPEKSPVLSGKSAGSHKIQGIGAGFIPDIFDKSLIDDIVLVKDEDAFYTAREYAKNEGVLIGISSGAALFVALQIAKQIGQDKKVLAIAPDGGEKYFSMGLYD